MRRSIFVVVSILAVTAPMASLARPPSDIERQQLIQLISRYAKSMAAGDMAAVFDVMPPRLFTHMALKNGMSADQLRAAVAKLSVQLRSKIGPFEMDEDAIDYRELDDGTPFALIPTVTVVKMDDEQSMRSTSHTLGLLDGGRWYLLRINDPKQMAMLLEIYPDFKGVEFPRGTMEAVKG